MLSESGLLLRIFISEKMRHDGKPLYEWIIRQAREKGLAGATVLRALEGFGAHSEIHTVKLLDLSTDLPIIVEIMDKQEKIEEFLAWVEPFIEEGLTTVEDIKVRFYRK